MLGWVIRKRDGVRVRPDSHLPDWRICFWIILYYVCFTNWLILKHMNHSSQFGLPQEWVPDAKMLDGKLSSQGRELMLLG